MKTVQQKYTKNKIKRELTSEITQSEFEQILADAIDESLSSLGPSAKQAIYYHLEKLFNIKKTEIPLKIEEFTIAIEDIFGEGARLLEIQMMKRLHQKAGTPFRCIPMKDELVFTDYMRTYKMI